MRLALCIAAVAIAAGSAIGATPTAKTAPAGTLKAEIAAFDDIDDIDAQTTC
jgi:hypothetical protein